MAKEEYQPFKCPFSQCPDYLIKPICHNHAHIYCEDYSNEKVVYDFLSKFRETEGYLVSEVEE